MTRRCESLGAESAALEQKYVARIEELNARAAIELKKARDAWLSGEKVRRAQWASEQTRAIKESTVKALEPEIQRLITQQKAELKRIEENAKETLRKQTEQSKAETDATVSALKKAMSAGAVLLCAAVCCVPL